MSPLARYVGFFEQALGYPGLADAAIGLAFAAIALAFIWYRVRIAAAVGSRIFAATLILFAFAYASAHLWNAVDRAETLTWVRSAFSTLAALTVLLLAAMVPQALLRLTRLSDAAKQTAEVEARVKVRDEFLSVAAHELKTPVTSIAGFGQLVAQLIESGEAERDPIGVLRRLQSQQEAIKRLTSLIDQLLDYSRLERGALSLVLSDVDLVRLAHDAARDTEYRRGAGRVHLSGPPEAILRGDATRLYEVLVNLLDNAAKFSSGDVEVSVTVDQGHSVQVDVRDYGHGIAAETLPHLFVPFRQKAAGSYIEGLGLGLAISKDIAELHGGSITARNCPGGGAEFRLWLPVGSHN
jgi:two-component system, OmpR family, sensor kinase